MCSLGVHLEVQLKVNLLGSEDLHNLCVLLDLVLDRGRHLLLCLVLGSRLIVFIDNDSIGDRSYCSKRLWTRLSKFYSVPLFYLSWLIPVKATGLYTYITWHKTCFNIKMYAKYLIQPEQINIEGKHGTELYLVI